MFTFNYLVLITHSYSVLGGTYFFFRTLFFHIYKTKKKLFKTSIEIIQCFQFQKTSLSTECLISGIYMLFDPFIWSLYMILLYDPYIWYKDVSITRNQFFLFEIRSMISPWQQNVLTDLYKEVLITVSPALSTTKINWVLTEVIYNRINTTEFINDSTAQKSCRSTPSLWLNMRRTFL